jgi:S1-C subfamily serine protease
LELIGLSVTDDLARYYNLPLDRGVLVTRVVDESPAQRAGIVAGDMILRIDGAPIYSIEDLLGEIRNRKVGEKMRIAVFRRGREQFFEATLSRLP